MSILKSNCIKPENNSNFVLRSNASDAISAKEIHTSNLQHFLIFITTVHEGTAMAQIQTHRSGLVDSTTMSKMNLIVERDRFELNK
ncbi:hypothetical protein Bhyg_02913, partial [Pseudolycoriella hygida]